MSPIRKPRYICNAKIIENQTVFFVDDDLLLADGDGEDEDEVLPAPDALVGSEATAEVEKELDGKQKLKPLKNEVRGHSNNT